MTADCLGRHPVATLGGAVKASWSASSARSKSPSRRISVARTMRESDR